MRNLMGRTTGNALSGLLIGSFLLAGPAPQPSPAILLSQIIESNPTPPTGQLMRPLEEMPKPRIEENPTPPTGQLMRPLEEMPKPPMEQNPTPPMEQPPTPSGEKPSM